MGPQYGSSYTKYTNLDRFLGNFHSGYPSRTLFPIKDNILTDNFPVLTVTFIAINVFVFIFLQGPVGLDGVNPGPVLQFGAIPYELTHLGQFCAPVDNVSVACGDKALIEQQSGIEQAPALLTVFTSMFMHGGWLHLGGNMLFLWIFGNNVEDSMGRPRFALFYLLGGVVALSAQVAIDTSATVPTIGASGAIAAVLGGYALLYPRAKVLTVVFIIFFFTVIEIPALIMLGIWFIMQSLPAFGQLALPEAGGQGGGVAYFAHIGGFLFGLLAIKLFATRQKPDPRRSAY